MYTTGTYIHEPIGNNAFSYNERIALGSMGKIFVPTLIQGTVADLEMGSEICFEEVVNNKLSSHVGLRHFVQIEYHGTPIFIVDNHNHALAFRYAHNTTTGNLQPATRNLIHIDQHTDTKPNPNKFPIPDSGFPIPEVEDFVNEKTNVGNFITAAVNSGIIKAVIQIRSEYALDNLPSSILHSPFVLDIDIDFRQGRVDYEKNFSIIRKLVDQAEIVTIATSPYFMDQQKAIEIIRELLK